MSGPVSPGGGRFDFDDGGTYCGGWAEGRAQGHGVCTGPKAQGEYSGSWDQGFEVCGVYVWPTGPTYEGQWEGGRQHGLGVETRGRWIYRGEWTEAFKGRYGVRQCIASPAKYDGTWQGGLQDGYGSETYADGGTFQGQWVKGMRHGYGVRSSAPFGLAARRRQSIRHSPPPGSAGVSPAPERRSLDCRGGFVLSDRTTGTWGRSMPEQQHKKSAIKSLLSRNDRLSGGSYDTEDEGSEGTEASFAVKDDEQVDGNVIETYMGEWKNDKRCGFGIAERSDGLKYEGEWYNNKKFGYGRTTYRNGYEEGGKYKNNILLSTGGRKHLFLLRSAKFKERVLAAVHAAHRSSQIALQKADIAISRTATARGKAEQADQTAKIARSESDIARVVARQFAPDFQQPGSNFLKPHFASSQDCLDNSPQHKSFLSPDSQLQPEPSGSAFHDLFRNNPDCRRPSTAGFQRRASTAHLRRPSTVVEHSIVPSLFDQKPQPTYLRAEERYEHQNQQQYQHHPQQYQEHQQQYQQPHQQYQEHQHQYPQQHQQQHQQYPQQQQQYHHQQSRVQLTLQQVVDDHHCHYYESKTPSRTTTPVGRNKLRPAIDLTELSQLYGIPLSRPPLMDDEDIPFIPQRRSTLPTVIDQPQDSGSGCIRTGSLYGTAERRTEANPAATAVRKNSLPDIRAAEAPRQLTREAIAALSSQRREAIRKQEEEALRLRANPLLYLLSPEVWDWLASQQLVILIVVVNVALGFIFFKVIL